MKLKRKLSAWVLFSLAFISCNQKDQEPLPSEAQSLHTQATITAHIDLESSTGNDLRASMLLDDELKPTRPFMNEKDLEIRIGVMLNSDESTAVFQTLRFKKILGQNRARYSGQIEIPASTAPTDRYRITGFVLREVDGEVFANLEESTNTVRPVYVKQLKMVEHGKLAVNIPYASPWEFISVAGGIIQPMKMNFQPIGTLMRFKIQNKMDLPTRAIGIRVETNAFFPEPKFVLPKWGDDRGLLHGELPVVDNSISALRFTENLNLPKAIDLEANTGESDWYYLWVMPVSRSADLTTQINVRLQGGRQADAFVSNFSKPSRGLVSVKLPVTTGTSSRGSYSDLESGTFTDDSSINTLFPGNKLPVEYLADYNVAPSGKDFATSHDNNASGLFNWSSAKAIMIDGYHLPNVHEWKAVMLPHVEMPTSEPQTIEQDVQVGSLIFKDKTTYHAPNENVVYALRFQDTNKQTAYRYELVGLAPNSQSSHLKLTCRYLGASFSGSITTIADESYWAQNADSDKTKLLPANGGFYGKEHVEFVGQRASYWSQSLSSRHSGGVETAYIAFFMPKSLHSSYVTTTTGWVAVRLFKNNP